MAGRLERVSSNGLLIGMLPECDYPVRMLAIGPGDRFLLITFVVVDVEGPVAGAADGGGGTPWV